MKSNKVLTLLGQLTINEEIVIAGVPQSLFREFYYWKGYLFALREQNVESIDDIGIFEEIVRTAEELEDIEWEHRPAGSCI